jgi:hypothetical protein
LTIGFAAIAFAVQTSNETAANSVSKERLYMFDHLIVVSWEEFVVCLAPTTRPTALCGETGEHERDDNTCH